MTKEPILVENSNRYSIFPVEHPELFRLWEKQVKMLWEAGEVDLSSDKKDWHQLSEDERYFIKNILAFFNSSDNAVIENLMTNLYEKVKYTEAQFFYSTQLHIEAIHALSYSKMLEAFIDDVQERHKLYMAIENIPAVKRKFDWALKWIENGDFYKSLIGFILVEGLFFSGSFCSIFWLKERNLMKGLTEYNQLINRDESLHYHFGVELYNNNISNKLPEYVVKEMIMEAYNIELEFITNSLPVDLIGMNSGLMTTYIQYVVDTILSDLNLPKEFNVSNPFPFMANIALENKTNFFEGRSTEYERADMSGGMEIDEDF